MSKPLKIIGAIAGAVALVAGSIATLGIGTPAFVALAGSVASYAGLAAGVASIGSQLLTNRKPPPARGSVTQVVISPEEPMPYAMGEGLVGGMRRFDNAYGATLKKVPNPYRWMVDVYSGAGPVESITPYVDQAAITSWYSGFLYTATQLGATPQATALTPNFAGPPGWTTASKLSGLAAIGWNAKFDKDGKVFASGLPQMGAYGKWVKVYDPRLDSTVAGGSGSHRLNNEATWTWSENPALHAGTYAYGRYQNGKRVMGVGLPSQSIDWVAVAAWANVCDTNAWKIFGVVYEPGDRWDNLKEICAAGGGQPVFARGTLSFLYSAPKIALDTISEADLSSEDQKVVAMASWRDRINTIVPKYRSTTHNWELVSADPVTVSAYVTADGEEKKVEWPFNMVKGLNQAAQLGAYRLVDSRELQPITLVCGPRMRSYRPGECLHLNIPRLGLSHDAIILEREFDPGSMTVTFTLMSEDPTKHAFALGKTGVAPPAPSLTQTGQERDQLLWSSISDIDFALQVTGAEKPSNYAGTSNILTAIGTGTAIQGNSTWKATGTHNVFEGGAVGPLSKSTAFISCAPDLAVGGYVSYLSLDDDNTSFNPATQSFGADFVSHASTPGAGTLYLVVAGTAVSNVAVTGITSGHRLILAYDGVRVLAILGSYVLSAVVGVTSGLALYPKVLHLHLTGAQPITDVQNGAWTDNTWASVGGTGRPSDNAGTSNILAPIGVGAVIVGNTYFKSTGSTHGVWDSGVVGAPFVGSGFISCSIPGAQIGSGIGNGICLDDTATDVDHTAQSYGGYILNSTVGGGTIYLYKNGVAITSMAYTGAVASDRAILHYDGAQVILRFANAEVSLQAPPGLKLYPKILELHQTGLPHLDITYGPYPNNTASGIRLYDRHGATYSIIGNTVSKLPSAASAWDYSVYSYEAMTGNALVTGLISTTNTFLGLTTTIADTSYSAITYAVHHSTDGNWYVFALGVSLLNMGTAFNGVTFSADTVWSVSYDGVKWRTHADGVLMHEVGAISPYLKVYTAIAMAAPNTKVSNVSFGTYTSNVWADLDGNGVPENYATTGQNLLYNGNAEMGDTSGWIISNLLSTAAPTGFVADSAQASNGKYGFLLSKGSATHGGGVIGRAMPIKPGRKYIVRINLNGSSATATGLYIRMIAKPTAPTDGVFIKESESTSVDADFVTNGPWPGVYTDYVFSYTAPAGMYFVSPSVISWINGPIQIRFDDFSMTEVVDWSQGVDGSGKPADNATVGATWGVNVGGSNKPADNATVGAAWGTNLTGRPTELTDGRVAAGLDASGNVNTNKVNTVSMVSAAVSNLSFAYTDAGFSLTAGAGATVSQTLTLTTTGANVVIQAGVMGSWSSGTFSNTIVNITIQRDGVTIFTGPGFVANGMSVGYGSYTFIDSPSAASHTYTLICQVTQDPATIAKRFLSILELKR
jgi:hypothetical protein